MESYRHTYATIWQAGGLFVAISAGVLALGKGSYIVALAPIPIAFWYFGIFLPMNRYGEIRNARLVDIEKKLNETVPGLKMEHYGRLSKFRSEKRLRVSRAVAIFVAAMVAGELAYLALLIR
ncbi:hypothetical protein BEK98_01845 [Streptomyces diastatochromogenes]|uniref:Uncharacterized protein n=2 Tax=Streptomyces diastatochromogenes TaxID=42236 RepID=A0A233SWE4_STRDA|nr:hypothetical protein BEK98_01845 [Streptomyces diastatochromogenes]